MKKIPILTAEENCLTAENWREIGIETIAIRLEDLLFKPGLELLMQVPNLAQYLNWDGRLILDARLPLSKDKQNYLLYSPYDGDKLSLSFSQLSALIEQLKPDLVVTIENENALDLILSNEPLEAARQGLVYSEEGTKNLREKEKATVFAPIDKTCLCPTCAQDFTQAYFHHLLENTPLLAERLLIMHNYFWEK